MRLLAVFLSGFAHCFSIHHAECFVLPSPGSSFGKSIGARVNGSGAGPLRAASSDRLHFKCLRVDKDQKFSLIKTPPDTPQDAAAVGESLGKWAKENKLEDIFVVSHGWRTSEDDALANYEKLFGHVAPLLGKERNERVGVFGIVWPSKEYNFAPNNSDSNVKAMSQEERLEAHITELKDEFPKDEVLMKALEAAEKAIEMSPGEQQEDEYRNFAKLAGGAMMRDEKGNTTDYCFHGADFEEAQQDPEAHALGEPRMLGFDFRKGLQTILNLLTFQKMMRRGAQTGLKTAYPVLESLKDNTGARIHLVGHSFGGLLLSAAANEGASSSSRGFESMTLLQAAFSHYGFAQDYMFKDVLLQDDVVSGPIVITHTKKDKPLSEVFQWAAFFLHIKGEEVPMEAKGLINLDEYGAMGGNGAQKLNDDTRANEEWYPNDEGVLKLEKAVNNIEAKPKESGGAAPIDEHSDVWNEQVAKLLVHVLNLKKGGK